MAAAGAVALSAYAPVVAPLFARPVVSALGAPLLGLTFGLAWTPCLTPTLTVVASLAQQQGSAGRGAFLSVFYCLGLGLPFILVALGVGWMSRTVAFLRQHARVVGQIGGGFLIVFGLLLLTGQWDHWMNALRSWAGSGSGVVSRRRTASDSRRNGMM